MCIMYSSSGRISQGKNSGMYLVSLITMLEIQYKKFVQVTIFTYTVDCLWKSMNEKILSLQYRGESCQLFSPSP